MTATKAIESAAVVAMLRATACGDQRLDRAGEDWVARQYLGLRERVVVDAMPRCMLRQLLEWRAPGSYGFTLARSRHFDNALQAGLSAGMEQLVLLGAGYDSRPMRFSAELEGIAVLEVDHPATQRRKRDLVAARKLVLPSGHRFVPLDFNGVDVGQALLAQGLDPGKRTLILWEGVSYYLPQRAVERVLQLVPMCAPGSEIMLDYAIRRFVDGDAGTYGGAQVARWLKRIGEPFLFGLDPSEVPQFLSQHGLRAVSDLGPADIEARYLRLRGQDHTLRTLGHVHFLRAATVAG